ncbi:hypothetical protein M427DRAFT_395051 [Gonapodya prolifera JEL478]|uniref:Uncharacterized protein n=1 Tax=Gonapodya prolifera (strain JEL478) TaxID=1344416 RepID=A0A139A775_GONPJ|nr:hypothetical protein M427DRAFT_395051 [Gonapodya prolifera JEL478]|eukprot:KXS12519.1 hypothetical protein M427DRAFT_395051 [Gonapodya prolifera JEL478]
MMCQGTTSKNHWEARIVGGVALSEDVLFENICSFAATSNYFKKTKNCANFRHLQFVRVLVYTHCIRIVAAEICPNPFITSPPSRRFSESSRTPIPSDFRYRPSRLAHSTAYSLLRSPNLLMRQPFPETMRLHASRFLLSPVSFALSWAPRQRAIALVV